jgi:amidase
MSNQLASEDAFAPAHVLLAALREGNITASALLALHLERIARYNPRLNAIVIPNYEQARRRAADADAAQRTGKLLGALHGLPLTIKDTIEVAGLPTTAGIAARAGLISVEHAPLVQRLLDAGGILLGKTNVPPYAGDWQADNTLFGRTNNPWDLNRTSGGSTGGGAAAVAAGLTPLAFGSDIAGSIRVPAAFCGIYGHRPSETAVPRYGHVPGSSLPNPALVMAVQGPLARDAVDLEMALNVIAGPGIGEEVGWRLTFPPPRHASLAAFRVALLPYVPWLPVDREIVAALDDLASRLDQIGAKVAEAQPEDFDLWKHQEVYDALLHAVVFSDLPADQRERMVQRLQQSSDPFAPTQILGLTATATQFISLHSQREHYRASFRAFFRDWDVLLAPVSITPAFAHISQQTTFATRTLQINGKAVPYSRLQVYPGLASLSGQPATAFPWGRTRQGLPIGLQVIGPYLEDRTPIAFAALLARAFGGFVPPPGYTTL